MVLSRDITWLERSNNNNLKKEHHVIEKNEDGSYEIDVETHVGNPEDIDFDGRKKLGLRALNLEKMGLTVNNEKSEYG